MGNKIKSLDDPNEFKLIFEKRPYSLKIDTSK